MKPPIGQVAKGRWKSILPAIGIEPRFLTGKHGPCPLCGPGGVGKDRFRFDDKGGSGTFYCSTCGAGDGVELVKRFLNVDFKAAAREIERHAGSAPAIPIRSGPSIEEVKRQMNDIWKGGKPLVHYEHTRLWWMARIGEVPTWADVRGVMSLHCPGQGEFHGMVALVRDPEGKPVNLHRTFLTAEGCKADIPEPRRVMPAPLPKGSAVRLGAVAEHLGVAEGLETSGAVWRLFNVPCWATLNAENMKGFLPPEGVRRITIYGDHDTSFTGQAAAFELARKLWAQRMKLQLQSVEVNINGVTVDPSTRDRDWNDVLLSKGVRSMSIDGARDPAPA
jgi:putative DNA primase/helicase